MYIVWILEGEITTLAEKVMLYEKQKKTKCPLIMMDGRKTPKNLILYFTNSIWQVEYGFLIIMVLEFIPFYQKVIFPPWCNIIILYKDRTAN